MFLPELPFLHHVTFSIILGVWPLLISAWAGVTLIRQSLGPAAQGRAARQFLPFRRDHHAASDAAWRRATAAGRDAVAADGWLARSIS